MKTSVVEVHAMLSVWSVDEVEQRIGKVPGVESVTVNYAAGSATVRYDETRLEVADIKSAVRQSGYESAAPAASVGDVHEGHPAPTPAPPVPSAPKTTPVATTSAGAAPATAPLAGDGQQAKAAPAAAQSPSVATAPNLPPPRPPRLPPARATRATQRRARSLPCRQIWRLRWAMAARTCRPWSVTCATVSGSA